MSSIARIFAALVILCVAVELPARAWVASAHESIAVAAVKTLPDSMPPYFRAGAARVGRSAIDPDYFRLRDLPQLRNVESPEHYLDSELLDGAEWPPTRYEYLGLLAREEVSPYTVGTLPYSLIEAVQRLAASFAQVRANPNDEWAQAKSLHHAGVLAHYSADLCQPLHTTIHYNGRARPDGSSPRSGIHSKTDGLGDVVFSQGGVTAGSVEAVEDVWAAIRGEFAASHALVDRVYELERGLGADPVSPEALAFGRERVAASVRFTAALFASAWNISGDVSLPSWFRELQPKFEPAAAGGASPAAKPVQSAAGSPR